MEENGNSTAFEFELKSSTVCCLRRLAVERYVFIVFLSKPIGWIINVCVKFVLDNYRTKGKELYEVLTLSNKKKKLITLKKLSSMCVLQLCE